MAIPSLMNPGMSAGDMFRQNMRQRLGFGSSPMPSQAPVGFGNPRPANPNTGIVPPGRGNAGTGATNPSMNGMVSETPPATPMPVPHPGAGLFGNPYGGWLPGTGSMPGPPVSVQPHPLARLMAQHYPWMLSGL